MEIRSATIPYSIRKKKIQSVQEKHLNEKYEKLYYTINTENVGQDAIDGFHTIKIDLEAFEKQRAQGIILRSKTQWVEEGEKNTSFFCNLKNAIT